MSGINLRMFQYPNRICKPEIVFPLFYSHNLPTGSFSVPYIHGTCHMLPVKVRRDSFTSKASVLKPGSRLPPMHMATTRVLFRSPPGRHQWFEVRSSPRPWCPGRAGLPPPSVNPPSIGRFCSSSGCFRCSLPRWEGSPRGGVASLSFHNFAAHSILASRVYIGTISLLILS